MSPPRILSCLALSAWLLAFAPPAWTQPDADTDSAETASADANEALDATSAPLAGDALEQRHAEVRREIAEHRERLGDVVDRGPAESRLEILRAIDALLTRSIEERRALDAETSAPPEVSTPPTSIAGLLELNDRIARARAREQDLTEAIDATREAQQAASEVLRTAEQARREARNAHDASPTAAAADRLALAQLRSRAAQEEVHLRELELRSDRAALQSLAQRTQTLEEVRSRILRSLETGSDVAAPDADLIDREVELSRREEAARRTLDTAELRLRNASARYASETASGSQGLEQIEALQLARDAAAQALAAVESQRERLQTERELRTRWLELIRDDTTGATRSQWAEEAADQADSYHRAILQGRGRLADLRARQQELTQRLETASQPGLRGALEQRRQATDALIRLVEDDLEELARQERLQRELLAFLEDKSGALRLGERLATTWRAVAELWGYEITTVDDEPITVGNAVLALLLFGLGFTASRRISLALRDVLDARLRLEPGVAGAAQTAVFYVLLVSFGLIALRTVNFPLTAFTVVGGALAIGVGFGSQNVMNNFISGLILMLERPVRGGDLVEVENTHGLIEQIGARSTRIRATDGRHIIVPNSFFLENNVVNWTLSDDLIRTKVSVGVIYGSPTRLVEQLIRQSLDENPKVLSQPAPIIVFSEFGDNSLNFDAYFWTRARGPMAVHQLGGEVRFRIDDLFRENDLVIAFPQRDVHLDGVGPLEIRLLPEARGERDANGGEPEER